MISLPQSPPFAARCVIRGRYVFSPRLGRRSAQDTRVVCAGFEECSPDYSLSRDGFPYEAVEYISMGEWMLSSESGEWKLQPGMVFTYGPKTRYSLSACSPRGLRKYFVDFEGQNAATALRRAGLKPGIPARLAHPRWAQDTIEQIIDTGRMNSSDRIRTEALLAKLLFERLKLDRDAGGSRFSGSKIAFEKCREHLSVHYREIESFRSVARACGVTQVHLCRLFRRYAGETPQTFLTRLRVNHAADAIVRGNMSVKEAALEVGFSDPCHFSRVFKKFHGIAPSKFSLLRQSVKA